MYSTMIRVFPKWSVVILLAATSLTEQCTPHISMSSEYLSPRFQTEVSLECVQVGGEDAPTMIPTSVAWSWSNPKVIVALPRDSSIVLSVQFMGPQLTDWSTLQAAFDLGDTHLTVEKFVWLVNKPTSDGPVPGAPSTEYLPLLEDTQLLPSIDSTPATTCHVGSVAFNLLGEIAWNDFNDYGWLADEDCFLSEAIQMRVNDNWPESRVVDIWLEKNESTLAHVVIERDSDFCLQFNWIATSIDPSLFETAAHELLTISAFFTWFWKIQIYADPPQLWLWFMSGMNESPKHYAWVFGEDR